MKNASSLNRSSDAIRSECWSSRIRTWKRQITICNACVTMTHKWLALSCRSIFKQPHQIQSPSWSVHVKLKSVQKRWSLISSQKRRLQKARLSQHQSGRKQTTALVGRSAPKVHAADNQSPSRNRWSTAFSGFYLVNLKARHRPLARRQTIAVVLKRKQREMTAKSGQRVIQLNGQKTTVDHNNRKQNVQLMDPKAVAVVADVVTKIDLKHRNQLKQQRQHR